MSEEDKFFLFIIGASVLGALAMWGPSVLALWLRGG